MFTSKTTRSLVALAAIGALGLSACSATDPDKAPAKNQSGSDSGAQIQQQQPNDKLRDMLPAEIRDAGKLNSVNSGSFPPYLIVETDKSVSGASADLLTALGQLWDVDISNSTVDGLPSILTGLSAGRYDLGFGPIGDFKERQESNDFIDFVQEHVVFAVAKGNPENITDLATTCGTRVAVQAGGSAEKVMKDQAEKCTADGDEAVKVLTFKDQPQSILAVQSGRADAFFSSQAPLTYFVSEAKGKLELTGTDSNNGFDTLYQGAVVQKDDELGDALIAGLQELFDNGTYEQIMHKWDLDANMIDEPGKNLAVS